MTEIRVMTWNVQNLFEFAPDDDSVPTTRAAYDAKIASLAAVIDIEHPTIVALQEVGTAPALAALQSALARPMKYSALSEPDNRGIRVAFLSTRVLRDIEIVRLFPTGLLPVQTGDDPPGPEGPPTMNQVGRPALAATIRAAGRSLTVVNCHLKSKLLSYPPNPGSTATRFNPRDESERARYAAYALYRRTAEATTLRSYVTERLSATNSGDLYVLAGDLNDEPAAATTQILQGPPGSEMGTTGFNRPDQGDVQRLWNLAPILVENGMHSRKYRERGELIDHLLINHALSGLLDRDSVHTSYPAGVPMPSVTDDPGEIRNVAGSDHAAVVATFVA